MKGIESPWEADSSDKVYIRSLQIMHDNYVMINSVLRVGNLKTEDSNELVVAVSSTVIIFLVIAILTLVAGFASGYYFRGRKCNESCKKTQDCCTPSQPAAPLYEYVDTIPSAVEHQEQGLELKENVAYGPSKLDS